MLSKFFEENFTEEFREYVSVKETKNTKRKITKDILNY